MKHKLGLTPGTPRSVAMRVTEGQDKLGTKEYVTYRSGLFLTKQICKPLRELSKTLDKPAIIYLEEMYSIIRYVLPP